MPNDTLKFPFYAKLAFTLVSLIAIFTIFYLGRSILTPLLISMLFAILLDPISRSLQRRLKFPHVIAVLTTVFLLMLFFVGVIFFLSWQISDMMSDWDKIKSNVNIHISNLQFMIYENFNLTYGEQNELIDDATAQSGTIVSQTLLSVTDTLMNSVLLPIYTFLILLYKTHFVKFLCKLFSSEHHTRLQQILANVRISIQSYISGLFVQMLTVSALTTIGYMIVGVEYAFLLGVMTGLLNLIPYIGILIAAVFSIAASLTGSADVSIILGVVIVNIVVQFIDNNLLVPMIVSSKVEVNALVSIVGIIIGGSLAGVAGMFLAIPLIAILKVVFDRIAPLEPWGYLMGDDLPKTWRWRNLKFPLYDARSTTDTLTITDKAPPVIFTETITKPDTEEKQ